MKIDQLAHFAEVARHQHIGKAASVLRISPSGVSYSIKCLEEDLGVELLEKRGKRIYLTDAGKRLAQKAADVQRSLLNLREHVAAKNATLQGHYRLGASHILARGDFSRSVCNFFAENPQISFELLSLRSAETVAKALSDEIELGLCFSPQKHPRLNNERLLHGLIGIYVRKDHPMLLESDPLKMLASFPAVLPKAFAGVDVCESHPVFEKLKIKPDIRMAFDDYSVAIKLVENSLAWGFFVDTVEELPGFNLIPLTLSADWPATYTINAIWSKERALDFGLEQLLQHLKATFNRKKA